ncbi:hypothetical protein PVAP13_5NG231543 [Panicum virgatum]|uniref:Uncharacterized protein n=1 Tax=Panicum virgatum TaxID=38727 RepID=A0A8T0RQP6_PANVG|nr:hypothetical protein PVAP13_5NG231543 [Panicum virgatum]
MNFLACHTRTASYIITIIGMLCLKKRGYDCTSCKHRKENWTRWDGRRIFGTGRCKLMQFLL